MINIIEKCIIGKKSPETCEDGIVINPHFMAVIDGSTSKTRQQIITGQENGFTCMQIISRYLQDLPADTSVSSLCTGLTQAINAVYQKYGIDTNKLIAHPEERLTASLVIYSDYYKQLWLIGDCQALVDNKHYDNTKPQEVFIARKRAAILEKAITQDHVSIDSLRDNDIGRQAIIGELVKCMQRQNIDYAVIDGFNIPMSKVKIVSLPDDVQQIVLASDGYPILKPTLAASETILQDILQTDPLCIHLFKATKGFKEGNKSFDDRSYIRFRI